MPDLLWILDSGRTEPLRSQESRPVRALRPAYDGQVFDDFGVLAGVEAFPGVTAYRITLEDAYLSFLPGLEGVVITRDGGIVGETTFNTDLPALERVRERLPEAASLNLPLLHFTDPWVQNYFHWLLLSLGKVMLSGRDLPPEVFWVLPEHSPFRRGRRVGFSDEVRAQTLARFGGGRRRLTLGPGLYRVPELHLLWTNFGYPEFHFLFDDFHLPFRAAAAEVRTRPGDKLLILRRDDPRMSEADRQTVLTVSGRFGYRPVHLEDSSFEDQLSLFAGATHVAGPHGAGLANLVFCPPGARVLELNKDLDGLMNLRPWFFMLAEGAGLEYRYLNRFKGDLAPARLEEAFSRMEDGG